MRRTSSTRIWRLLWALSTKLRTLCDKSDLCRDDELLRISIAQAKLLDFVCCHGQSGLMLKEIAQGMQLSPGAASLLVDQLVKRGLLARSTSENDRRAIRVELSARGKKLQTNFETVLDDLSEKMVSEVSDPELGELIKTLEKIDLSLSRQLETL